MDLSKLSTTAQLLVIVLIIVGFFIVFYVSIYSGKAEQIEQKKTKLSALQQEIERGEATAKRLGEFQQEVERLRSRFQIMLRILPNQKQTEDLLRKIQSLARDSNLDIKRFDPGDLVRKEFYAEYPISMRVHGSYHNLATFFDKVSKLSRLINITGLVITFNPEGGEKPIIANYTATTFVFIGS
ncbi:hypothetical protein CEE39_03335 [bacterium (candidate division B38) B3_B38]|nr:MAG: hypothetical protein CEE39_03335 [bacterium (candidate division B38) B3_B38]